MKNYFIFKYSISNNWNDKSYMAHLKFNHTVLS